MPIERHTGLRFKGQENVKCLRYPNLATFHPLRYLHGVAGAVVKRGGALFAHTAVTGIEEKDGVVTVRAANNNSVQAAHAVIAIFPMLRGAARWQRRRPAWTHGPRLSS